MSHFEKREWDQNTWLPEVAGVDFTKRLYKFMGDVALDGTEIYTAWLVTDDQEIQITPENGRVFVSLVDDESDTITVLDPSDGLWFHFMRLTHGEAFDQVLQLVTPWTQMTTGITPAPEVYERFLKAATKDSETDDLFIPDGWE
jgi:hypothetical protein